MIRLLLALMFSISLINLDALPHDGSVHRVADDSRSLMAEVDQSEEARARQYFTELPVVTQNGETLRFFSDVLKDRIVLVSLFYTNCIGMCPITNARLAEVQDLLGAELGKSIYLISVTLDPETDTPEVLRDYASKFEAKEGWLFLTGKREDIKRITRLLGQVSPQIDTHTPYLTIGNVKLARWAKVLPDVPAEIIAARLRLMASYSITN